MLGGGGGGGMMGFRIVEKVFDIVRGEDFVHVSFVGRLIDTCEYILKLLRRVSTVAED